MSTHERIADHESACEGCQILALRAKVAALEHQLAEREAADIAESESGDTPYDWRVRAEALEERIAAALDYLDIVRLPRAARIANVQTILTLDTAPSSPAVDAQADHE